LQAINNDYQKKSRELFNNDNMTLREYKGRLLVLRKEKKEQEQNLLTTEQKNQVAEWKKRSAENQQVRAAAFIERMKIRLNLTNDQVTAIKAKQVDFRTQMHSIYENDGLLPAQKREQMKALAMNQRTAIKSVLTPEQISTFENMHKQRYGEK